MPPTAATPTFSDADVLQLMDLLKGADSVELKLTVPEPHQRSTAAALDLDPLQAQIRQVFFDTPKLALDAKGVVVRARRIQGKGADSVVKLRPVTPSELPEDLRRSGALRLDPPQLGRRLVAEMWIYPDGSRILELSTRAETNEAFQVAAEARAFLLERGVDLTGEQETKTRKALRYFTRAAADTKA